MNRIVLLRHGPPNCPKQGLFRSEEFGNWARAYDAAALIGTAEPPAALMKSVADIRTVFCSPLERSRHSAALLFPAKECIVDPLFREAEVPIFTLPWVMMPVDAWLVLSRLAWVCGADRNCESQTVATLRARQAARQLIDRANDEGSVALVGHGWFNRMLASWLRCAGWRKISASGGYWGCSEWRGSGDS